jgi:PAS domain S-box-containing protein
MMKAHELLRLAAIVESTDDAIIGTTLAGEITSWNAGAQQVFGYTADEVVGRPLAILVPPDRLDEQERYLEQLAAAERIDHFETVRVRKNGDPIDVSVTLSPIVDAHGQVVGVSKIARDITRRKRVEALVAAIVDSSDDAIVSKTLEGVVTSWNVGAERIFGYTAAEMIGRPITTLFPPELLDDEREFLTRLARGERIDHFETVRVRKDGQRIDISVTLSPILDGAGRTVGISKIARDITERKLTERELQRREHELADFFDNATVGLHWVGPDGHILRANRAELELLGYTAEEYVGHHIAEFHADARAIHGLLDRLRRDETVHGFEARLVCKDGSFRDVLIDSSVMREDGRFLHTRGFTRDVTDRRRAERELATLLDREQAARREAETANRMKDEFLATLSHELRTPINAVYGWARMLRVGHVDAASAARGLEVIERNAKMQVQLIEDLLDISRIITGKLRLDVRLLELPPIIHAALDAVRPAAEAKNLTLDAVLDSRAGPVHGDADRIQQVLWNLLANAVKFTPKSGRVQVRLARVNSQVQLTVSDTGQGIAPDMLPRIFDRFWQADSSSTRAHGGLGIGLALVRHLVELHGGTVGAASAGEGQGATFTVKVPVALARGDVFVERLASQASAEPLQPSLDGIEVLAVEDDRDSLYLIAAILERYGATVKTCTSVAEALDALRDWRPHVLLSDLEMPGEDGYALIRKVRALPSPCASVPAVALTAYGRGEDRVRTLLAGFTMHVGKPVDPAELAAIVASLARAGRS